MKTSNQLLPLILGTLAFLPLVGSAQTYRLVDLGATHTYSAARAINQAGVVAGQDDSSTWGAPALFRKEKAPQPLCPPSQSGMANAINNRNQVAGIIRATDGSEHAALFTGGLAIRLPEPDGTFVSRATGVNDSGAVIGVYQGMTSGSFLYQNGQYTTLGYPPGDDMAVANAINRKGQITGGSANGMSGTFHVFLYQNGQMQTALSINGQSLYGNAINDHGDIAGTAYTNQSLSTGYGFLFTRGVLNRFGPLPGDQQCYANAVNSIGQVVGTSELRPSRLGEESKLTAVIYSDGYLLNLNSLIDAPGWKVTQAFGINDQGQIAVAAESPEGDSRAVRLDPVASVQFAGANRRRTSSPTYLIRGAASAPSGVSKVKYRIGRTGRYHAAAGTTRWRATVQLRRGMNHISVRTIAKSGRSSLPVGIDINVR